MTLLLAIFLAALPAPAEREAVDVALAGELARFPVAPLCAEHYALAQEHLEYLQARQWLDADLVPDFRERIIWQGNVVEAYRLLKKSRCQYRKKYPWASDTADELRELLGEAKYLRGWLPGAVPCVGDDS